VTKRPKPFTHYLPGGAVLTGRGATWTVTTVQTNDPTALVATPIPTYVRFDGSTLAMENDYGQAAVWRKQ
jgi:hypothetical protein